MIKKCMKGVELGQPEEDEDTLMIFNERKLRMGALIEKGHEQQSRCLKMIIGHG